jgi:hypothetical protein
MNRVNYYDLSTSYGIGNKKARYAFAERRARLGAYKGAEANSLQRPDGKRLSRFLTGYFVLPAPLRQPSWICKMILWPPAFRWKRLLRAPWCRGSQKRLRFVATLRFV